MQHPENIRKILKRAGLSEGSELNPPRLARVKAVLEREADIAAGKLKGKAMSQRELHRFIMKSGDAGGGKAAGSSRVPGKMSMNAAAKQILGRARGPLHAHEVCKRALEQKLVETKGKTPEQTMAARLAVGTRKGEFKRTAPNTYTLPDKKAAPAAKKPPKKEPVPAAA